MRLRFPSWIDQAVINSSNCGRFNKNTGCGCLTHPNFTVNIANIPIFGEMEREKRLRWGESLPTEHGEKKIYTLNDIAKELGVNKATVSKAISGKGNLSAQTRARILAFIDQCGYRPNAVAQSLAKNQTYNIGLMMPDDVGVLDEAFFRESLRGVCRVASSRGYDVLMVMDSEKP